MLVDLSELKKWESEYIATGFKKDQFKFTSIDIDKDKGALIAYVDFEDFYLPPNGSFHLSTTTKERILVQLMAIFIFYCEGTEKNKEILELEQNFKFNKLITKHKGIKCQLKVHTLKFGKSNFYKADVNIEDGAFIGDVKMTIT